MILKMMYRTLSPNWRKKLASKLFLKFIVSTFPGVCPKKYIWDTQRLSYRDSPQVASQLGEGEKKTWNDK